MQIPVSLCLLVSCLQVSNTLLPSIFTGDELPSYNHSELFKPSREDLEQAIDIAKRYTGLLRTFENTIRIPSKIQPNTPAFSSFLIHQPEWMAIERGRQALLATKAATQLIYICHQQAGIDLAACSDIIKQTNFYHTSLEGICSYLNRQCNPKEMSSAYRSIDGTCNHVNNGSLGESFTAFERLLQAKYMNHFDSPKQSVTKSTLPSPRRISQALVSHGENLHESLTSAFVQFGQFIEHDLSNFASSVMIHINDSFNCCDDFGYNMAPRYTHPLCMSIPIPSDDNYYSTKHLECMNYVRSLPAIGSSCSMGYLEQQNQATHFLDASQIYGNTLEKFSKLRSGVKGKLQTNGDAYLALDDNSQVQCQNDVGDDVCFVSGDSRVNLHPQITVMYTLWVKEHNRIAEELHKINSEWNDETLFQEARRIVVAEIQHIVYNQWLKNLLGEQYMHIIKKSSKYNQKVNPSISNEFATAAMRSLYSMLPGNISLIKEERTQIEFMKMHEHFNKPLIITQKDNFDSILRGMTSQRANKLSTHFSHDLTNKFLENKEYGYDLLSLDIQRGRDHGLPGFNAYRVLSRLDKATNFTKFLDAMSYKNIHALSMQYQHVDDVDLLIGGLLENSIEHSLVGPTFSYIFADQFLRTKIGDRYFYTNLDQPAPFSRSQLSEISKISLARIICDNSNVKMIQSDVFNTISESNKLLNCHEIPRINLNFWKESREKYA